MTPLSLALRAVGAIFVVGPVVFFQIWPSGWKWEPHQHEYEHMILAIYAVLGVFLWLAAKNPAANTSLIWFTVWSSAAHALAMAVHGFDDGERMHLVADIPALLLVAALLGGLMLRESGAPERQPARS